MQECECLYAWRGGANILLIRCSLKSKIFRYEILFKNSLYLDFKTILLSHAQKTDQEINEVEISKEKQRKVK